MRRTSRPGGRDLRVGFVGDPRRFASWVPSVPVRGFALRLLAAGDADGLARFAPDVVVVLDVDAVPPAAYAGVRAPVVAVAVAAADGTVAAAATPPRADVRALLRAAVLALAGWALAEAERRIGASRLPVPVIERVERRLAAARARLGALAPSQPREPYDRLVAVDPQAAGTRPLWRLIPPPVDDRLFATPQRPSTGQRVLVAQPSTLHREALLTEAKHFHDLRHVAHGVTARTLPATDVAIALAPRPGGRFDHDVAVHLAAGHLVMTDALTPAHGLEPGIDVLPIDDDLTLERQVGAVRQAPAAHFAVRVRGRRKAERFRASRVWPELVGDLLAELGR